MRRLADAERLRRFLKELARDADGETDVYLTGGATAVLLGWRESTVDADILIVPDRDSLYRAIPRIKEELQLNVEIASPADFIPELPGWRERSLFMAREGRVTYRHYDPYAQLLSKVVRGFSRDLEDARMFLRSGMVDAERFRSLVKSIPEPAYAKYPAIARQAVADAVEAFLDSAGSV